MAVIQSCFRLRPCPPLRRLAGACCLVSGLLALPGAAVAQDECPDGIRPCCRLVYGYGAGYMPFGYPADGATGLSRWTPVLSSDSDVTVSSPGSGGTSSTPYSADWTTIRCGTALIPTVPLEADTTYEVYSPLSLPGLPETTFTTGNDATQPEMLVEVGDDVDPSWAFRASVHSNRPMVGVLVAGEEWMDLFVPMAEDWELVAESNEPEVDFVGPEGQVVRRRDIIGVSPPPVEDPAEPGGGCECGVARTARGRAWVLVAAAVALYAARRRHGRP